MVLEEVVVGADRERNGGQASSFSFSFFFFTWTPLFFSLPLFDSCASYEGLRSSEFLPPKVSVPSWSAVLFICRMPV